MEVKEKIVVNRMEKAQQDRGHHSAGTENKGGSHTMSYSDIPFLEYQNLQKYFI